MMMITLHLPEGMSSRVARAAAETGSLPHEFIAQAITEKTERAEAKSGLHALAQQRYEGFLESGESIAWADIRTYLQLRLNGQEAAQPSARKWRG